MSDNVKYFAKITYGRPALTKLTIERETPKMLVIESTEDMIGRCYVGEMLRKDKQGLFDKMSDAIEWLISNMDKYIRDKHVMLDRMESDLKDLRDLLGLTQEKGL